MKASEVLTRYAAGETNFQRVNLRGQSLKGENLSGADFSEADLRGTNFIGANLRRVNFTGAKCGLQKRWAISFVILSWLCSGIATFGIQQLISRIVELLVNSFNIIEQIIGFFVVIVVIALVFSTIQLGIMITGGISVVIITIVVGVIGAFLEVFQTISVFIDATVNGFGAVGTTVLLAIASSIALVIAGGFLFSITVLITIGIVFFFTTKQSSILVLVFIILLALIVVINGAYLSWRSVQGDKKDAWMRNFAIAFAAFGGTSFCDADLTDANFAGARLKSTDMREATLTRVRWYGAKMLDLI
jgi:uncharacterized protein YjbI with pentapeptide repeats